MRCTFEHFVSTTHFLTQRAVHFRQHEHCLTPDLARSAHAYMHVSHESDFDLFESNNLQFFILGCVL